MLRQLNRGNTQTADAENRDRFAGTQPGLVQGVQGSRGRTHQDRALFKRNFVRQTENVPLRHDDEFSITAVAIFADHLARQAKLFRAASAQRAMAAGHEIMHANAIAFAEACNFDADFLDSPGHFMTERDRQIFRSQNSAR